MEDYEYETDSEGNKKIVQSANSNKEVFLRFCNRTDRRINIIWINYNGKQEIYKTLYPKQYFDVNTFATHPWIFKDAVTNERFVVKCQTVFRPQPVYKYNVDKKNYCLTRISYNITMQLKELRQLAMLAIMKLVKVNDIDKLEVPKTLEMELRDLFQLYKQ